MHLVGSFSWPFIRFHAVMLRASTIKNRAKIREETSLPTLHTEQDTLAGVTNMMAIQYSRMHNAFQEVEIFDRVQPGDTEEIDDVINKGTKKIVPRLLLPNEKKLFDEKYLPAMIILKGGLQLYNTLNQLHDSTHIFQLLRKDKNLKGHSKEFEDCLKPDHELVTSPDFEKGVVKIMNGQSEGLTVREQNECSCLLKSKWPPSLSS